MKFKLKASFKPTGDQPQAIDKLTKLVNDGEKFGVLLGVTGSGKTYTVANVIEKTQKPVLLISHNKTLAAQLYQEFKEFFPDSAVSYFVSYYDYYQPEAYIPQTDTYISKDADINKEIDKLRLRATSQIFSRKDVIVVASVSCIYNIGSPEEYRNRVIKFQVGQKINQQDFLYSLIALHYQRTRMELDRGLFSVRGETVQIFPAYADDVIKIKWDKEQIVKIISRSFMGSRKTNLKEYFLYPAKHYLANPKTLKDGFRQIRQDLKIRLAELKKQGKQLEAQRLNQRVNYDLEMIQELGYVNGIENYSRYFDGRLPGEAPYTLVDYFKKEYGDDFLVVIDESHMTVPQIRGMYRGDRSRKQTLIDFGFRMPSALDNRPLKAEEFWPKIPQSLFLSATPQQWEMDKSKKKIVEQLIRPTGLVDPEVEVRSSEGQITDLIKEILKRKKQNERVLITTLTKRMAEELSSFLADPGNTKEPINVNYLHADINTMERTDILASLRSGEYDVIVGINLLREGLDLPEVSLVAILDADKQGFLRSRISLVQTMGRAARNINSKVILYGEEKSQAMKEAIEEVDRRRKIQLAYNKKHKIIPKSIKKPIRERLLEKEKDQEVELVDEESLTPGEAKKIIKKLRRQMREYAKILEFEKAGKVRDKIGKIKDIYDL